MTREQRFVVIDRLLTLLSFVILVAFLVALPFSNSIALRIYLAGIVATLANGLHWFAYRRIAYNMHGIAATLPLALGLSQGGFRGRLGNRLGQLVAALLWPSQFVTIAAMIVRGRKGRSAAETLSNIAIIIPQFLLFLPFLLILSVLTYVEISRRGATGLSIFFAAATTVATVSYMLAIGVVSFREYVSRNLVNPAVNAGLIAIQLCAAIVLIVTDLLKLAGSPNQALGDGVAQVFSFSKLGEAAEQALTGVLRQEGPASATFSSLLIIILVGLFFIIVIKTLFSGVIFGRTDSGRFHIANYWRVMGRFQRANDMLRPIDSKSPAKQSAVLQIQIAQGQLASALATASKLLRTIESEDSKQNRAAIVVISAAGALLGIAGLSMKAFALDLVAEGRKLKLHPSLVVLAIRSLHGVGSLSEREVAEIRAALTAEEQAALLWKHLDLVIPLGSYADETEMLLAGRSVVRQDADLISRAFFLAPVFELEKLETQRREAAGEEGAPPLLGGADAFIDSILGEIEKYRFGRKLWEVLVLLSSVGVAMKMMRMQSGEDGPVTPHHLEIVDEWVTQLANEGVPGMAEFDLNALTGEIG